MFLLTAFADEIAPDLATQLTVLSRLKIPALDLRTADGKNVLALTDDEARRIKEHCDVSGIRVQCLGTPIGKLKLSEAAGEPARLRRAVEIARLVRTARLRIFAPESDDPTASLALLRELRTIAQDAGMILLLENDARYWNAFPENAKRMFDELGSPHFRAAFDFANTVQIGFGPGDWFPWLTPHLDTLHMKDAKRDGTVTPVGEGDGEVEETLKALAEAGWSGALTLEPHLATAGAFAGTSGEALFTVATNALKLLSTRVGIRV